jgi:hypothetical protein
LLNEPRGSLISIHVGLNAVKTPRRYTPLERQSQPFQLSFNASLKVDCQGSRVTSDGGLILVREFDGCLARCCGGSMSCQCRADSTAIALAKSVAEGEIEYAAASGARQTSKNEPPNRRDLAGACSGGKFVVSRTGTSQMSKSKIPE